jgi:hypothetical protein
VSGGENCAELDTRCAALARGEAYILPSPLPRSKGLKSLFRTRLGYLPADDA